MIIQSSERLGALIRSLCSPNRLQSKQPDLECNPMAPYKTSLHQHIHYRHLYSGLRPLSSPY